ncbi:MAG: hypothetical protein ACXVPC_09485 [Tumebacillaceae bacterium]
MFREPWKKVFLFAYLITWLTGSMWLMAVLRSGTLDGAFIAGVKIVVVKEYLYYAAAGAIGGTIYVMRLFHDHYHSVEKHWFYWYIMRPFLCASTAAMTIVLFKSGIMLLQISDSLTAKIAVSFLVGYGFGKFIEKLKALTITLFDGKETSNGNGTKSNDHDK